MNKNAGKIAMYFILIFYILQIAMIFIPYNFEESTGPNDYARITNVEYKAELVDEPGQGSKAIITERLTYDIHAASTNNLFWELWRDLPEDVVDGLKVDYKVNYVKQLYKDGTEKIYTESPKLYWDDSDYISSTYGPGKWYHSVGPYNEDYGRYECVFFYVNGIYRDQITFEIQYEMNNAALRYKDVSELYLSMYSEETIKHLESFKGQILISEKDMPSKNNYLVHTYGTNSHTFDYTESDTLNPGYHTFSFNLDKEDLQFKKYNQYLEFTLLSFNEDKHIFTEYAPSNYYSNDIYLEEALDEIEKYDNLPTVYENTKKIVFIISIVISIKILFNAINRDKKIRKKHMFYKPTMTMEYFRDIPSDLDPYFAASIVFSKHKHKVDVGDSYAALMLSLVRKKYITLEKINENKGWTFNNIMIKILYKPTPSNEENILYQTSEKNNLNVLLDVIQKPKAGIKENTNISLMEKLTPNEEAYFNLIVKEAFGTCIPMDLFQKKVSYDYDNTDTFVTSIENSIVNIGISEGYFQKSDYKSIKNSTISLSNTYMILGLILIIIGNLILYDSPIDLAYGALFILGSILIISSIYLKKHANKYILFTQFGEDEYAKWRALYNFLNSQTLMKERTVVELPLWEKYLIYATAFGISDKVIKALEINCPNVEASPLLSNNYYRSSSFRTSSHSFRSATRNASNISRSHRHSGGSYYGGGGRGGGGGGGGH